MNGRKIINNKITLSGLAGSGKSTVGKLLAEKLNSKFYSAGNISRDFAYKKYNMTINKFQILCDKDSSIDKGLDEEFRTFGKLHSKFIMDYRLGFHFIDNSFNIFLAVSNEEAINRVYKEKRKGLLNSTYNQISELINTRNYKMRQRFLKLFYRYK